MKLTSLAIVGVCAGSAAADGLEFRFEYSPAFPAPNSHVLVSVHAMIPPTGTVVPWTTPPGIGQPGTLEGFSSVLFNLAASAGAWSNLHTPPMFPCGFGGCPIGQINGSSVNGISPGIGFGVPIAGPDVLLWTGQLTLPSQPIPSGVLTLDTTIVSVGNPPHTGIEVQLSGIMPLNVSHFLPATNAHAILQVPAPAGTLLLGLGGLVVARRRRPVR